MNLRKRWKDWKENNKRWARIEQYSSYVSCDDWIQGNYQLGLYWYKIEALEGSGQPDRWAAFIAIRKKYMFGPFGYAESWQTLTSVIGKKSICKLVNEILTKKDLQEYYEYLVLYGKWKDQLNLEQRYCGFDYAKSSKLEHRRLAKERDEHEPI